MTVIAKLVLRQVVQFNTGSFAHLDCICENDLMAEWAKHEDTDKLFTRYSPWGEMRLNQRANWAVFHKDEEHVPAPGPAPAFYVILLREDEVADAAFPRASAFVKVNCYEKAKRAGDGSRVELREVYGWAAKAAEDHRSRGGVIEKLSWKMHVDNPPAEDGFVAGRDYWVAFYDAAQFTMHEALAAAHGRQLQEADNAPAQA